MGAGGFGGGEQGLAPGQATASPAVTPMMDKFAPGPMPSWSGSMYAPGTGYSNYTGAGM